MLFYSILFFLLVSLLILSYLNKRFSIVFDILFYLILLLVAGLRGDVGQDTYNYQFHYYSLNDFSSFIDIIKQKEPFLYFFMYPHKLIFSSYTGFLFFVSFLQVFLLSYAVKDMYHKRLFLLCYILIVFAENHFNIIRVSFAVLFFLCSLSVVNFDKRKAYLFFIFSLMSHLSALVFIPILLGYEKFDSQKVLKSFIACLFVFLCVWVGFGELIISKLDAYNILQISQFRLPRAIFIVLLCLSFLYIKGAPPKIILLAFLLFTLSYTWSSVSDIAYRIFFMYFVVLLYLVFMEKSLDFKKGYIRPYVISALILSLWLTTSIWSDAISEKENGTVKKGRKDDFTLFPYSFYWDSNYRL